MGIIEYRLKTHSRENITDQFPDLNNCVVHNKKPIIQKMVVGRRKDVHYTASCDHDECGKIAESGAAVVAAWNKWNPK